MSLRLTLIVLTPSLPSRSMTPSGSETLIVSVAAARLMRSAAAVEVGRERAVEIENLRPRRDERH